VFRKGLGLRCDLGFALQGFQLARRHLHLGETGRLGALRDAFRGFLLPPPGVRLVVASEFKS